MASATVRLTFSFPLITSKIQTTKPKIHLSIPLRKLSIQSLHKPKRIQFSLSSVDVSKEDKPSDEPISEEPVSEELNSSATSSTDFRAEEREIKLDARRFEEKFAVLNTGIYECRSCGHVYDEAAGDPSYPIPPGFQFEKLPDDWRCPTCGAAKSFFVSKSVEIAGFAQNQQFGLGGNTLTSGQKAVLIYGSLFLLFMLFLSGYFLQ